MTIAVEAMEEEKLVIVARSRAESRALAHLHGGRGQLPFVVVQVAGPPSWRNHADRDMSLVLADQAALVVAPLRATGRVGHGRTISLQGATHGEALEEPLGRPQGDRQAADAAVLMPAMARPPGSWREDLTDSRPRGGSPQGNRA